jgi:hypothetical protein
LRRGPPAPELASPTTVSSASPATVDRRLWCSSGPIDPASCVARARRCSPTSPTEPATAGRPSHRCTPPPDRHRRREPATVSLLPPFVSNRDHRRPGLLPGRFPANQRLPTDRIWPVSRRRRRGFPLPCFRSWTAWPSGPSPAVGGAQVQSALSQLFSNSFELIQINSEFD